MDTLTQLSKRKVKKRKVNQMIFEKMHFIDIDITMDTLTQLSKRKVKKEK